MSREGGHLTFTSYVSSRDLVDYTWRYDAFNLMTAFEQFCTFVFWGHGGCFISETVHRKNPKKIVHVT